MTLLSYQVFVTVVEQKSFYKAAELLRLTPSAISHSISSMEKELGFSLFSRSKQGVYLTSYGESLLPYVRSVLNSDEYLHQAVSQLKGLQKGSVKIGAFNSVCTNWLPKLVQLFHDTYPHITIEIYQGTYNDVAEWLKTGRIDVGFLSVSSAGDLPITPLYKDRLVCVVPKGFQTIHEGYITIDEIQDQYFVTQRESCDADIQNFLQKYHLNVRSNCHVVDDLATVAMVMGGFGICIMPELVMNDIPYSVDIYPIQPNEYRIIGLTTTSPEFMAPAVQKVVEHIIKHIKQETL
jgi:DNA-binding transcriptional LysR family regulator